MKKSLSIIIASLLTAGILAGCGSSGSSDSSYKSSAPVLKPLMIMQMRKRGITMPRLLKRQLRVRTAAHLRMPR